MSHNTNRIEAFANLVHHYLIWIIVASYMLASILPEFGLWLRHVELGSVNIFQARFTISLPPFMLALLLFNAGIGVKVDELFRQARTPGVLIGGLLGNLAIPLLISALISYTMRLWHDPEEAQQILVGLALVAAMPIAGASTAWSQNADGNLALSLGLVLFTTLLSPLFSPLVFHSVGYMTTGDYSEDLHELASGEVVGFLGAWVITPSLLGICARRLIGEANFSVIKSHLKLVNFCVLVLLNYSNASITLPEVISQPDMDFIGILLIIVLALCLCAFGTGYLIARLFQLDRQRMISLVFGLGMNNNGTGLVLASMALVDHPLVMLPIIFYNLIQHLVASLVDRTIFQRAYA